MALTGILFWFFGFFYCLYYFFFLVNMALIPITKPIFRERDSSAMYFDHGWIKKTMHCFSVTRGGGGIQRNANNAFRPDTRDPDRVVSYAQFVWKKEILLDYLVRILLWITVKSKLFPRSHVVWHFQMFTHCRLIRFF